MRSLGKLILVVVVLNSIHYLQEDEPDYGASQYIDSRSIGYDRLLHRQVYPEDIQPHQRYDPRAEAIVDTVVYNRSRTYRRVPTTPQTPQARERAAIVEEVLHELEGTDR